MLSVCTFRRSFYYYCYFVYFFSSLFCWPCECRFQCAVPVSLTQRVDLDLGVLKFGATETDWPHLFAPHNGFHGFHLILLDCVPFRLPVIAHERRSISVEDGAQ